MADRHLTCAFCARQFVVSGQNARRYCSDRCKYTAKDRKRGRAERVAKIPKCTVCGAPGLCKGLCSKHYLRQLRGSPVEQPPCVRCGSHIADGAYLKKYCSAGCRSAATKPEPKGFNARMVRFNCSHCGKAAERHYRGTGVMPTLCGAACKKAAHAKRHGRYTVSQRERISDTLRVRVVVRMVGASPMQGPPEPRRCGCGEYIRRKWAKACPACAEVLKRQTEDRERARGRRQSKNTARLARKMRERAASVEAVNPIAVLSRDKWRCQLCGVKTPKALRGTSKPNAPELDHIIPISKGGEHSYRNTQCACRACNAVKGDRPLGQMRLFG